MIFVLNKYTASDENFNYLANVRFDQRRDAAVAQTKHNAASCHKDLHGLCKNVFL